MGKTNKDKKAPTLVIINEDDRNVCQNCEHGDALHYGTELRWCNQHGCQCQALKLK